MVYGVGLVMASGLAIGANRRAGRRASRTSNLKIEKKTINPKAIDQFNELFIRKIVPDIITMGNRQIDRERVIKGLMEYEFNGKKFYQLGSRIECTYIGICMAINWSDSGIGNK